MTAATFLGACAGRSPPGERRTESAARKPVETPIRAWEEPPDYSFEVRSRCGEQSFIGSFRIEVRDGKVEDAEALDESARAALRYWKGPLPTLGDLVGYAVEAQDSGAGVARIDYSADGRFPVLIEIDYDNDAIDDESCFSVTELQPRR